MYSTPSEQPDRLQLCGDARDEWRMHFMRSYIHPQTGEMSQGFCDNLGLSVITNKNKDL